MAAPWRTQLIALPLLATPLLVLAACDQVKDNSAPAERRAEGQVLGGTISDEMIPLDRLRSQSPPMRVIPSEEGGSAPANDTASPAEDEPAAEPSQPVEESAPANPTEEEG